MPIFLKVMSRFFLKVFYPNFLLELRVFVLELIHNIEKRPFYYIQRLCKIHFEQQSQCDLGLNNLKRKDQDFSQFS